MKQAIDFEDVLTSPIVGQRRTGHCALPCFHHVHSLKPPFTVSPTCLQLGDLRAHKLQGAPVRPGANWNHQLAEVQLFGDHRLSVPSQTGLWILQPWPIKQVGQHRCVIKMCHLLLLRFFPRTPGTEATPLPHQEQREGKLHVRPGRSGGNEVGTSGGDPRGGAHERHLVLSRWLHQEQGKAPVAFIHHRPSTNLAAIILNSTGFIASSLQLASNMSLQVMGNIEPAAKVVLWTESRQPIQTWTAQMRGLITSLTFPGMVLDVKGTAAHLFSHS